MAGVRQSAHDPTSMHYLIGIIIDLSALSLFYWLINMSSVSSDNLVQSDREAVRLFLERLRQHRLKLNWSQAELARRAGLSRPAYQNFENGYGNITLRNLLKILGVLGLTNQFAQLIPPVTDEPTLASLTRPTRQRARRRPSLVSPAAP